MAGALAAAEDADVVVLVDVLSFTTTVSVALDRGIEVLPRADEPEPAPDDAVVAQPRDRAESTAHTLSPARLRAAPVVPSLVLPSPNGSAIAHRLATRATVVAACLRNRAAVIDWLRARRHLEVAVVAAGERWPGGELRPAIEDLWGAGAVLAGLGVDGGSPEVDLARLADEAVRGSERAALEACASGRELIARGFPDDVAIAAEVDTSATVPVLVGDRFVDASG